MWIGPQKNFTVSRVTLSRDFEEQVWLGGIAVRTVVSKVPEHEITIAVILSHPGFGLKDLLYHSVRSTETEIISHVDVTTDLDIQSINVLPSVEIHPSSKHAYQKCDYGS